MTQLKAVVNDSELPFYIVMTVIAFKCIVDLLLKIIATILLQKIPSTYFLV